MIGEVEDSVEPLLEDANATLNVVDETDGRAFVKGNNDALAGALGNLIENAIRHGGEQISIDLSLTPVEDGYCIRIEDDGVGIAEDIRHQIFNPFFTTSSSGTGLGLAVVQYVILAHGGAIRLLDDNKRRHESGAGFVICLPDMSEQDQTGLENDDD